MDSTQERPAKRKKTQKEDADGDHQLVSRASLFFSFLFLLLMDSELDIVGGSESLHRFWRSEISHVLPKKPRRLRSNTWSEN
jgi:hypothetical protein